MQSDLVVRGTPPASVPLDGSSLARAALRARFARRHACPRASSEARLTLPMHSRPTARSLLRRRHRPDRRDGRRPRQRGISATRSIHSLTLPLKHSLNLSRSCHSLNLSAQATRFPVRPHHSEPRWVVRAHSLHTRVRLPVRRSEWTFRRSSRSHEPRHSIVRSPPSHPSGSQ